MSTETDLRHGSTHPAGIKEWLWATPDIHGTNRRSPSLNANVHCANKHPPAPFGHATELESQQDLSDILTGKKKSEKSSHIAFHLTGRFGRTEGTQFGCHLYSQMTIYSLLCLPTTENRAKDNYNCAPESKKASERSTLPQRPGDPRTH